MENRRRAPPSSQQRGAAGFVGTTGAKPATYGADNHLPWPVPGLRSSSSATATGSSTVVADQMPQLHAAAASAAASFGFMPFFAAGFGTDSEINTGGGMNRGGRRNRADAFQSTPCQLIYYLAYEVSWGFSCVVQSAG